MKLSCPHCGMPIKLMLREPDPLELPEPHPRLKPKTKRQAQPRGVIPELSDHPEITARLEDVLQSVQRRWLDLYGNNPLWIKQEILKAMNWMESKQIRRKDFGRFMSNWLSNAAENHPEFKQGPGKKNIPKGLDLEA